MTWLLHSLKEALYEPAGYADLKVAHIARALAADVLSKHIAPLPEAPVAQYRLTATQAKLVADYIQEHLSSKILLKDLTALIGLSQTVLLARFRASFGLSPYRYVIEKRVHRARKLLGKPSLPIAQIAVLCGFADQAHLTVTFKRIVGMTPTRYRQIVF
jgi:transcriptional regulator GlxA family with amidase domain